MYVLPVRARCVPAKEGERRGGGFRSGPRRCTHDAPVHPPPPPPHERRCRGIDDVIMKLLIRRLRADSKMERPGSRAICFSSPPAVFPCRGPPDARYFLSRRDRGARGGGGKHSPFRGRAKLPYKQRRQPQRVHRTIIRRYTTLGPPVGLTRRTQCPANKKHLVKNIYCARRFGKDKFFERNLKIVFLFLHISKFEDNHFIALIFKE